MEFSLARLGSKFTIVKSINGDAVFAIDLCLTIGHDLLATCLACHLHNSTFEVLLVVGLLWVFPVIASVAVDFSDHLDYQWVVVGMRMGVMDRWWWRSVVVWRRVGLGRWRWRRFVVVWWW